MPNRNTHVAFGGVAGSILAAAKSEGEPLPTRLLEIIGGLIGGGLGGQIPDILEPPTSPWHRGSAHSVSAGASLMILANEELSHWQAKCRSWADSLAAKLTVAQPGSAEALLLILAEAACRFIAGLLAGLIGGYISHITLDAFTPCGIRLI